MDLKKVADNLRHREKERDKQIEFRRIVAGKELEKLVRKFLTIDPAIRRIILFGSLASGKNLNQNSDIDLAVDSDAYFRLVAATEDCPIEVDLLDLKTTRPAILNRIMTEGKVLYEAE